MCVCVCVCVWRGAYNRKEFSVTRRLVGIEGPYEWDLTALSER